MPPAGCGGGPWGLPLELAWRPFLLPPPRPAPPRALPAPWMVLPGSTVPGLKIFNSLLGGERTHLREIHRVDEAGHAGRRRGRSVPP